MLKSSSRWLLGILFIAAGLNHLVSPRFYVKIMPPYLPWHLELIYISGAFESLLGILLLVPGTRRLAAWGLIALLVAVFPANLHMAMHPELFPNFEPWMLWARLPFQAVLIAWAYWYTTAPAPMERASRPVD